MIVIYHLNYYIAVERGTANYSGYAESEEEFRELCAQEGYDLDGCEVEELEHDVKPHFGRSPKKHVRKDLGKI